jgi:hypothetical protein
MHYRHFRRSAVDTVKWHSIRYMIIGRVANGYRLGHDVLAVEDFGSTKPYAAKCFT